MRVLVTGSSGMLGGTLLRTLLARPELELVGIARTARAEQLRPGAKTLPLDLTAPGALSRLGGPFDWILHTAANVNVDACETDREGARALHAGATAGLVGAFPEARFVYISTDSVFDGRKAPYSEDGATNPLNHYAATKLEGEKEALRAATAHVLRLSIFGFHAPEAKNSLAEWAIRTWESGKPTPGFEDIFFNPVYCGTLSELLRDVVLGKLTLPTGVLHLGSAERISKLRFLQLLARELGFPASLVQVSRFADQSAAFRASRPADLTLTTTRALAAGLPVPRIESEIAKLAADLKSNKIRTHEKA